MAMLRRGRQSIVFDRHPAILSTAAIGGKKELEGPLHAYFDELSRDTRFRQRTWEKAESKMQALALETAKSKAGIRDEDIDVLLSGDLLNQCVSSSFAVRDTDIPFLGLYGACSTMAEALLLAGVAVNSGYAQVAAAMSSSHFATAERQYRFPLGYGGQRTPTAQWTVTGSGAALVEEAGSGPRITGCTIGTVRDLGIQDANNMGAAMAPAAFDTIKAHLEDFSRTPEDFDLIVTGDLGQLGKDALLMLGQEEGLSLGGKIADCGTMIFDATRQDVHSGGSGCGCSAVTLCGYLLDKVKKGELRRILFCGTGALLSPVSTQQGLPIPGVCHGVSIEGG